MTKTLVRRAPTAAAAFAALLGLVSAIAQGDAPGTKGSESKAQSQLTAPPAAAQPFAPADTAAIDYAQLINRLNGIDATMVRLTDKLGKTDYTPAIVGLFGSLVGLVGVGLIVHFTRRNAISEHWLKTNAAEADYIQSKLDKFYGPFFIISQANHLMAQDLRQRQQNPGGHRLLAKLFDAPWKENLTQGDKTFVAEICKTGERLSEVVQKQAGLVAPEILPYIARAMTHFRILALAHKGELGADSAPYLRYIYPKELDAVLDLELKRLRARLTLLREQPAQAHGPMSGLDLSAHPLPKWPDPQRPDYIEGKGLVPDPSPGKSLLESLE